MDRILASASRQPGFDAPRRLISSLVAAAFIVGSVQTYAQAPAVDPQLKELQEQINLLRERVTFIRTQTELETLKAQAEFAKLAGVKAGLNSVGAPPGKDGEVTVNTGDDGALLLKLKAPMITGLETAATRIADSIVLHKDRLGGAIVIATDADVQAALQAAATRRAMQETAEALQSATEAVARPGLDTASVGAAVAGASLVLQTINDFSRLFRTDRAMTAHGAGEEAEHILRLLLENRLSAENGLLVKLDEVLPQAVIDTANQVKKEMLQLKGLHARGKALLDAVDQPAANNKPNADDVEKLRAAVANAKALFDTLDPAQKAEAFWTYVGGRYKDKRFRDANGKYFGRLTLDAKAQTVQVIESRTFRSDKIYGTGGVQVAYRIVDGDGALLKSELWLFTIDSDGGQNSARVWPATGAKPVREAALLSVNE